MKEIIFGERAFPKWLIFMIDQLIISWSLSLSLLIAIQFEFVEILVSSFFLYTGLFITLSSVVFVYMRIHTGIIRYSNIEDIPRIFSSILLTTAFYILVVKLFIVPNSNLVWERLDLVVILNFFISTSLLILLRTGVKSILNVIKKSQNSGLERVLIYGCDKNSIPLKQAIEVKKDNRYEIVGFINNDVDKVNKHIEQIRVYHSSAIRALKSKVKIDILMVMSNCLNTRN